MMVRGDDGAYDVVLAASYAQAANWNRERALVSTGGAFGQVAQAFDDWAGKLWEQNGDGRALVSRVQARMAVEKVVAAHAFDRLERSPGLGQAVCVCARAGLGVPTFDEALAHARGSRDVPGLTAAEAEVLLCVAEYADELERCGLVELGAALGSLAERGFDPGSGKALFLGDAPLNAQQLAFFERCAGWELHHDENLEPARIGRTTGVDVRCAFPSGGYAQAQVLLDVIADALALGGAAGIVVSSANPLALYERLASPLAEQGISCSVQGRKGFAATDFGKAYLAAQAVRAPRVPWDKAALTDVLHSSFARLRKTAVWRWDERLRGDRIIDRDQVLSDLRGEGESGVPAFRLLDDLARGAGADPDALDRQFRGMLAAGLPASYVQEQRLACYALLDTMAAAAQLGCDDGRLASNLVGSARFGVSRVSQAGCGAGAGIQPVVRIMDQRHASELAAGSADALIICDLTTESYPLREPRSAAHTLLAQLGAGPRDTALARARRSFASLLRVPAKLLVMERPLNDADASPYYPSALFEEFADAYRGDADPAAATAREKKYGVPAVLLEGRYERGEENALRDVRPRVGDAAVPSRTLPAPIRGNAGALADRVAVRAPSGNGAFLPRLSASQLENYLDCPYKWFVLNRLKATEIDEELGPREAGSFLHEVFRAFYLAFGRKVTAGNLAEARGVMFGADGASGVFAQVVAEQYELDGCGRKRSGRLVVLPDTSEVFEIDYLRTRVERWLAFETTFLPGFTPVVFECSVEGEYEGCLVKGVIDRIDIDGAGRAVVIDYKGSLGEAHYAKKKENRKSERFVDGKVQALMYASLLKRAGCVELDGAVSRLGGSGASASTTIEVADVVGALYVSYNRGNAVSGAFNGAAIGVCDIPTLQSTAASELPADGPLSFEALLDHAGARVRQAVAGIGAGEVSPQPANDKACAYCPVATCEKRCGHGNH